MADLVVFRDKRRQAQLRRDVDARYSRRLADEIVASFYEACRIGNLEAASHLLHALECEVARSARLQDPDQREDGHDLDAARARYQAEATRLAGSDVPQGRYAVVNPSRVGP